MEWTINAIPFGGFVRMEGESGDSSHPHAFSNRPLAWRMLVICGGVIMNFLLGWGLLTASFMIGIQMPNTEVGSISIGKLIDGMPASLSDLKENDTILQIDNTDITSYENFLSILKNDAEKKQSAKFTILRNDKKIEIKLRLIIWVKLLNYMLRKIASITKFLNLLIYAKGILKQSIALS